MLDEDRIWDYESRKDNVRKFLAEGDNEPMYFLESSAMVLSGEDPEAQKFSSRLRLNAGAQGLPQLDESYGLNEHWLFHSTSIEQRNNISMAETGKNGAIFFRKGQSTSGVGEGIYMASNPSQCDHRCFF